MIESKSSLYIKYDADGTYTDYSHKCSNFSRDTFTITLDEATDYIYIGFKKPINALYFNHNSTGYTEGSLTLEYYNGSTYTPVSTLADDTFGLYRSGFIKWERSLDHAESTEDSTQAYWYRLRVSAARTDLEISGINLVFADDYELSLEQPYINTPEFLGNLSSHIKTHAAVRNEVIQRFRNKNYIKVNQQGQKEDINVWDLHDIDEVKQAAVYLAISKIYSNMSDDPTDVWQAKADEYYQKFEKYIQIATLSLDTNDDGIETNEERATPFQTRHISR